MNNLTELSFSPASCQDASFIARMIMMAMHIPIDDNGGKLYSHLTKLVDDEHSLYHWSRTILAKVGDEVVGMCLAYDGYDYHERRLYSFSFAEKEESGTNVTAEKLLSQPDESGRGEYYIDSLAVLPQYRGHGVGRQLLSHAVAKARELHLTPTILVAPDNHSALRLYQSIGFVYQEEMFVFGENYWKMTIL